MDLLNGDSGYVSGQCLVAMPAMNDPRFAKTVVYICAHSSEGAMGLVINRTLEQITFPDLLEQLGIESGPDCEEIRVHFGGPVESGRGFVLHSSEYQHETTMMVDQAFALTATVDVLRDIAGGRGPRRSLLALGYAGWSPGQLDSELSENVWLTVPADDALLFSGDLDAKWQQAMGRIGVDLTMLSGEAGHG